MRTGPIRRCVWSVSGAAATMLFVACATQVDGPDETVAETPSSSGQSAVAGRLPASEQAQRIERDRNPATGDADTVIVTGARIRRSDFSSPNSTRVVTGEDLRALGVITAADMVNQLPSGVASATAPSSPDSGGGADSAYSVGASIARLRSLESFSGTRRLTIADSQGYMDTNGRDRSPLSRVAPGEEVWIISQEAPAEATVADDALGSGVMLARFETVALTDTDVAAEPPREIPLPLKHTDVDARVQGYVGTVDVTQQFENPYDEKIEAVYMFPLPEKAAVSEFVMTIGERRIRGILREKEEAQAIYQQARAQGYQASLLTQHRPNIFEQKVANIEPGNAIDVNIRYYETLTYADGWYSFVFPTVVGPRYNPPGTPDPVVALPRTSFAPTPDAAVRYLTPATTSAHDISIAVELDAGVGIEEIASSHELDVTFAEDDILKVALAEGATIPNKDFLLSFRVAGDRIKSNLLTHIDEESGEGYFTLMMYPPADLEQLQRQPVELVFVLDTSGSMSGAPIEQAKAAIIAALDRLDPNDTFQVIRFSQNASQLGPWPVQATPENIRRARQYVRGLSGSGGTHMIEGIRAALNFPHDDARLRFVTFLTDGFIGNETDILAEIDSGLGASRIFSFGVGSAPNRYLLERMAGTGRGAAAFLSLDQSGSDVMDAFFDRIAHPAMIDVEIDWGRMDVADIYPRRLPDLFVGRPVVVTGRFQGEPDDIRLSGRASGNRVRVRLNHEGDSVDHEFLPQLWARLRIADLNDELAVKPQESAMLGNQIRETALAYSLMSDYTSFVAVDASAVTSGGHGTTVYQAVPVPEGVRYETTVTR